MSAPYCVSPFESSPCLSQCKSRDISQQVVAARDACAEHSRVQGDATVQGSLTVDGAVTQSARSLDVWNVGTFRDVSQVRDLPQVPVGSKYAEGARTYRYASSAAGGAALKAGQLLQSQTVATTTLFQPSRPLSTAAAVGATTLSFTTNAAIAANAFADGTVHVEDAAAPNAASLGYTYRIQSHPAADSGTALLLTLYPDSPVAAALAAGDEITVRTNLYANVLGAAASAGPPTGVMLGFALNAVTPTATQGKYYWIQTGGPGTGLLGAGTAGPAQGTRFFQSTGGTLVVPGIPTLANYNAQVPVATAANALTAAAATAGAGAAIFVGGVIAK